MKVLLVCDTFFRNVIISASINGVTLKNLHNYLSHKVLIINIVVLTMKYHTDLTVSYTSGFYSEHVTIWRVFYPNTITRILRSVCNNKLHMELTSSTIDPKIINTISVESTNTRTPSPFETFSDWDHFTAEKEPWELRNNLPFPEDPVACRILEFWRISFAIRQGRTQRGEVGAAEMHPPSPRIEIEKTQISKSWW
jgi:hypothetical protein